MHRSPPRTPSRPGRALTASSARSAALSLALVLAACTPEEPLGGGTSGTASSDASTGDTSTGDATTTPTSGGPATTGEPPCLCHADCPDGLFCYPGGGCNIDPNDCGEAIVKIPIVPADLVLVLDKSASMGLELWDDDGLPGTPPVTRWHSLHGALEQVLPARERSINFGAVLSPSAAATSMYSVAACPVEATPELAVAPMNAAALIAALPPASAQSPALAGATPTRAALTSAIGHLEAQMDGLPRAVALVTDGAANCSPDAVDEHGRFEVYDEAVAQVVTDAAAAGITTFVVGLAVQDLVSADIQDGEPDATNLFDRLNELALAGGAPQDDPEQRFLGADDQPGIEAALTTIADALASCTLVLDPLPVDPNAVELSVDDVKYGDAADVPGCAGLDGWRFVDVATGTVELCGQACAGLRATGVAAFRYRCSPPPQPPQCPSP